MLVLGVRLELTLAFLLREWLLPIERPELGSPCLLVKGTDCAGVCDALAWRVVPVFPGFGRPGYLLA